MSRFHPVLLATLAAIMPSRADGGDWPCFSGPHANFSAAENPDIELVDDLNRARLVWKSEDFIPVAKGHNPGSSRLGSLGKPEGGGASPIVAEGLVYIWYYQPSGDVVDQVRFEGAKENGRYGGEKADPLTWRTSADEVVVAIDAETGKTVWKQVFKDEGINIQSGKDAGISNHTMCFADGRVYAMGTMGRVYCLDAKSGDLLWRGDNGSVSALEARKREALQTGRMADKKGHSHEHGRGTGALMTAGDVLIVPMGTRGGGGLIGLNLKTGEKHWQHSEPVRGRAATPTRWIHEGIAYVITANERGQITCLEANTGKIAWTVNDAGANFQTVSAGSRYLVAKGTMQYETDAKHGKRPIAGGSPACYKLSPSRADKVWDLPFDKYIWDEQPAAIASGCAYLRVKSRIDDPKGIGNARGVVIELATGTEKGTFYAPFGGGDCATLVTDGRIIADADGSHNHTRLFLATAAPDSIRTLNGEDDWTPPHTPTSGYHPAMNHAYADGRLYIRGLGHIVCYDLRRTHARVPVRYLRKLRGTRTRDAISVDKTETRRYIR